MHIHGFRIKEISLLPQSCNWLMRIYFRANPLSECVSILSITFTAMPSPWICPLRRFSSFIRCFEVTYLLFQIPGKERTPRISTAGTGTMFWWWNILLVGQIISIKIYSSLYAWTCNHSLHENSMRVSDIDFVVYMLYIWVKYGSHKY